MIKINIPNTFILIIIISSFFSISMTLLSYSMPENTIVYLSDLNEYNNNYNTNTIKSQIDASLNKIRTGIPLIDVAGSLIFFTGNILLDLLLNFVFAIPSIINMFIKLFLGLFIVEDYILMSVSTFVFVLLGSIYIVSLVFLFLNVLSGGRIGGDI